MKRQNIIAYGLKAALVFGMLTAANAQTEIQEQPALKRFDINGDGKLSEAERELMINTVAIETFLGVELTERELRDAPPQWGPGGGPGGFGFGGPRGPRRQEQIADQFDADNDGKLSDQERKAAREYIQNERGERVPVRPSGRTAPNTDLQTDLAASKSAAPEGTPGLYDEKTLRTLYLRFSQPDWYEELGDFYRTDVNVPADLIVDGKVYSSVGVHFRGSSSYFGVRDAEKKSLNISIDYGDSKQRLYDYRTLNLLNGHSDASFLREVLYSRICREYLPAPKANFVKLVINGENWGVYVNVQQFNKDFLAEWFGTKDGVRWKVPPGPQGALVYLGETPEAYQQAFQLKTQNAANAWENLIRLCKTLNQTPDDRLEAELEGMLNIDRALWFIALENVFIDNDGYISRGSDYSLYQDADGRFHMIPRDNNETFRYAGGGGPNDWPDGTQMLDPLGHADNEMRPLISRLLAIPHLRARYLAHLRTIVNEQLDWNKLAPIIAEYQSLIDAEVKTDDKKLYPYEAFATSQLADGNADDGPPGGFRGRGGRGPGAAPSFKRFVEERRAYLLSHPEIDKPAPTIQWVSRPSAAAANQPVRIAVAVGGEVQPEAALLYYAANPHARFQHTPMRRDGDVYSGEIPAFPAGATVYYYVEARAVESNGTTAFEPARAEFGALTYRVNASVAETTTIVINEFMADNVGGLADPQGENDDWIELHNTGEYLVDLSGMYLSDDRDNPTKWKFPENTILAPKDYLIVWADEDSKDRPGLHANFKLSKNGEAIMLVDADARGNRLLDIVEFGKQEKDAALGRFPNGAGDFRPLPMSPGKKNQ